MSDGEINVDSIDGEVSTSASIIGNLYPQGEKGDKGDPGNDGFSPTVTTEKVGKTTTITITDAEGEHVATILDGADGQGSGDMRTEVYDINQNGIVDDAEKVNGHTVGTDVPADAKFTDTTYTAGTGIDITGNVITNTQTSAEWGNITGTLSDQTDLKNALDDKANSSSLSTVATSGDYSDLLNKPSIPTNTSDLTNNSGFIDKDVNNLTNYDTSTAVDTKISNSEEVLIGSDSGIKASHELWVDTNDVTPYVNSEISNEYGTAQNLGYSQEYVNDRFDGTKPMGDVFVDSVKSKNMFNPYEIIQGTLSATTGDWSSSGIAVCSNFIEVDADTTYTIKMFNANNTFMFRAIAYDPYKSYYSTIHTNLTTSDLITELTFTTVVKGYVRFVFGKESWAQLTPSDLVSSQTQLEKGSTYSTYKPYQELNNQEVYSTTEQVIGTWIDGKPLYRVVLSTTTPSGTNDSQLVSVSALSIETITRLDGYIKGSETINANYYYANNNYGCLYYQPSGPTIRTVQQKYNSKPITIVLEYTKTTD